MSDHMNLRRAADASADRGRAMSPFPLGRLVPGDFRHLDKYPLAALASATPATVERILRLPQEGRMRPHYHQGRPDPDGRTRVGACVGFSLSWLMTTLNRKPYDAFWLYDQAQQIDEWPGQEPAFVGTSVRAGCDVLLTHGHSKWAWTQGDGRPPDRAHGIAAFRWARTVDEMRAVLAGGQGAVLGCNWLTNFDTPEQVNGEWWIGRGEWGRVRGGHAIFVRGGSDQRGAVLLTNSWGTGWGGNGDAWLPYGALERLLRENGECVVVVDK